MGWDYAYTVGEKGGTMVALAPYCELVRIVGDGDGTGKEGENADIQYLHGHKVDAEKFMAPGLLKVECTFRYTNGSLAITHADGAAGHMYENMGIVKQLFYGNKIISTLRRTAPHQGTVEVDGEVLGPESVGELEWRLTFPFSVEDPPFWRSTTLSGPVSPTPSITVGGNAPVDDFEVAFSGGTNALLTHTASGRTIGLIGATPGGGVTAYPRRGVALQGATDHSNLLTGNHPSFFELRPGQVNAFSLSGGGTATIAWRNKWRL